MKEGFRKKLAKRQKKADSLVCVGLDPLPQKIPRSLIGESEADKVLFHMKEIVDATAPYASMFKPQSAHWEAIKGGKEALEEIVIYIHREYPDIPVFLDCKRGDIGRTQERYAVAHFELDGVDGMNFNPYMGRDCMEALVRNFPGKGIAGLCYTSNLAAREIQNVKLASREYLYEYVAKKIVEWAEKLEKKLGFPVVENTGLVMAAAYEEPKSSGKVFSDHLKRVREIVGNKLWFLIPGVGTQGGFVEETVKASYQGPGSIVINSSSAIIFASTEEDFKEAAAKEAEKLRDQINKSLP
jgi:orotidine-5'-phosphate decarboxylase